MIALLKAPWKHAQAFLDHPVLLVLVASCVLAAVGTVLTFVGVIKL